MEAKFADQVVQAKENFSEFQRYRSFLGQLAAMDDSQSEEMYSIFLRSMKSKYQTACLVGSMDHPIKTLFGQTSRKNLTSSIPQVSVNFGASE